MRTNPKVVAAQLFVLVELSDPRVAGDLVLKGVDPARWTEVMRMAPFLREGVLDLRWDQQATASAPAILGDRLATALKQSLAS